MFDEHMRLILQAKWTHRAMHVLFLLLVGGYVVAFNKHGGRSATTPEFGTYLASCVLLWAARVKIGNVWEARAKAHPLYYLLAIKQELGG
jgi:hypothetical protein